RETEFEKEQREYKQKVTHVSAYFCLIFFFFPKQELEQLERVLEKQMQNLIETQEKERIKLLRSQIQQEKDLQHNQHEEQDALLKDLHGKMLILHRKHCIEEEEFQRQLEAQTLSLLQEQQRQHGQL